jgi:diguanylate cyclase (GGDEF)-like protein
VIGRLGGEEFTLLLRGVDGQAAEELAERLRRDIAALVIAEARVTASVGIAEWQPGETLSDLLHRADLALLEAKRLGRDCIVHWSAALAAKPVPRRMARPAALPTHEPIDGNTLRPLG